MGKKSSKSAKLAATEALSSGVQPLLELKHEDPIFSMAAHPSEPLFVTGSASGRVKMVRYDAEALVDQLKHNSQGTPLKDSSKKNSKPWSVAKVGYKDEFNSEHVTTAWKTRRHKGSCRSITFDKTGEEVYTVGLDKIIKCAATESGKVVSKTEELGWKSNVTKLLKAPNKDMILAGTETGNVFVYDTRTLKQVYTIPNLHDDAVNSLTHQAGVSDYKYISVGSTTVAEFDVRKGIVRRSEDQGDELLSADYVDRSNLKMLACGMGEGVVTLWKPDKNDLVDQISRVRVSKESVECVVSTMDDTGDCIWAGTTDGLVKKVNCRMGKVIEARIHSMADDVSFLDIDYDYRLISCGMDKLKLWSAGAEDDEDEGESDFEKNSSDDDSGSDSESDNSETGSFGGFSEEEWENIDEGDDSHLKELGKLAVKRRFGQSVPEEPKEKAEKPVKREENSEKEEEVEEKPKKTKKQRLLGKQIKNMQTHEHGIRKFDDL